MNELDGLIVFNVRCKTDTCDREISWNINATTEKLFRVFILHRGWKACPSGWKCPECSTEL